MKFKTFQAMLIAAGVLVVGSLLFLGIRAVVIAPDEPEYQVTTHTIVAPAPALSPESRLGLMLGRPANGETKRKDELGPNSVKLNVYAEDGIWARAKIDRDRDERWDEKWRWEAGVMYRSVAPADDEVYGPEQVVGAPPSAARAQPSADRDPQTDELRELDRMMLDLLERPVQAKIKDASKGRPFKINIYSDDGTRYNRAKVDLDRDERWDESWTFKADGAIERKVSPADDDVYSERFVLEDGARWQAVKD